MYWAILLPRKNIKLNSQLRVYIDVFVVFNLNFPPCHFRRGEWLCKLGRFMHAEFKNLN